MPLEMWAYWAVVILILAIAIRAVIRAVVRTRFQSEKAKCGRCGYLIDNRSALRCSECGGWFHLVGLLTPESAIKYRGSFMGLVIGWTAIFLICGNLFTTYVGPYSRASKALGIVQVNGHHFEATITPVREEDQRTGERTDHKTDYTVQVEGDWLAGTNGYCVGSIGIAFTASHDDASQQIRIDLGSRTLVIRSESDGIIAQGSKFTPEQATDFLRSGVQGIGDEQMANDAMALASLISALTKTQPVSNRLGTFLISNDKSQEPVLNYWVNEGGSRPAPLFSSEFGITPTGLTYGILDVAWLLIYALGLTALVRRRMRLLRGSG